MVPEGGYALAGSGPLLWLYAAQAAAAGAPPALVLDTTPRGNLRAARRGTCPASFAAPTRARACRCWLRARRAAPVVAGVDGLGIVREGEDGLLLFWMRGGREDAAPFDQVLLHHGVTPNLNLARAAGCALDWHEDNACFVPRTDAWGRTTVPGVLLAGDGAGIGGRGGGGARRPARGAGGAGRARRLDEAERDGRAAPLRAERARWLRGRRLPRHALPPGAALPRRRRRTRSPAAARR